MNVLLCWLSTMRPHVEGMFTSLHLRLEGSGIAGEEWVGGQETNAVERQMTEKKISSYTRGGH